MPFNAAFHFGVCLMCTLTFLKLVRQGTNDWITFVFAVAASVNLIAGLVNA